MAAKLSYEDFLKSFELAPRLAVELLIENKLGELLLLKRTKPPFKGNWHLPGGFLLKDEPIRKCIERLARDELKHDFDPNKSEPLGLFETIRGDPRGHILHYPVRLISQKTPKGRYFKKLPKETIPHQATFLNKLGYKVEK